jgi:hypothetical protein
MENDIREKESLIVASWRFQLDEQSSVDGRPVLSHTIWTKPTIDWETLKKFISLCEDHHDTCVLWLPITYVLQP